MILSAVLWVGLGLLCLDMAMQGGGNAMLGV